MIPSAILLAIAAAIIFGWSGPLKIRGSIILEPLEEPFTGYGNVLGVVMALLFQPSSPAAFLVAMVSSVART